MSETQSGTESKTSRGLEEKPAQPRANRFGSVGLGTARLATRTSRNYVAQADAARSPPSPRSGTAMACSMLFAPSMSTQRTAGLPRCIELMRHIQLLWAIPKCLSAVRTRVAVISTRWTHDKAPGLVALALVHALPCFKVSFF